MYDANAYGPLPRGAKGFLLVPAIYITVIHAMSVGSLRYRLPAEPMMAVIAASVFAVRKGRLSNYLAGSLATRV